MTQTQGLTSTSPDSLPWSRRLFEIFVSQKMVMFVLSLGFIWVALPADGRVTPTVTAITVFGGMKAVDYVRDALTRGGGS